MRDAKAAATDKPPPVSCVCIRRNRRQSTMTRAVRINPEIPDDERQNPDEQMYGAPRAGGLIASKVGDGSSGTSKVFPEDHEPWRKRILDPGSNLVMRWNKVFLTASLVALFIDPLYLYLLSVSVDPINSSSCIKMDRKFRIHITILRTITDLFYVLLIAIKFRTAYVAPSSRVFGRGELVTDPRKIAWRYLQSDFFIDLASALPFPQIVVWVIMPAITNSSNVNGYNTLALIILIQYIPRSYLISPLSYQIIKATRFVTKTAWTGAAYNLLLYMIASHVVGATFYLLTVERQMTCWKQQCKTENGSMNTPLCDPIFLDCDFPTLMDQQSWANSTSVFTNCNPINTSIPFNFGIFTNSVATGALSSAFSKQFFFNLWWGLQNLCTYGQGLTPSTYIGETTFASVVSVLGLVLFAQLIGNMETYLESITVRLEEWRLKRRDTEEWMKHRQLPPDLRERVRRFVQYKWFATRGVDEESVLRALPADLRRDIQSHLCLNLVRRVPLFSQMDDQLLDAICECLVSSLSTEGTYIVREGDPVIEMLFIIRGRLESSTTNGGQTGFFNSIILRPGDFCGEELLSWALLPNSTANLPHSTRTVKALVEVEAFALRAEDLKFVANQFRRLHSKKLQHTFRFYSHHWRTWAACFIQAGWRRFKRRKKAKGLSMWESFNSRTDEQEADELWHQEEGGGLDYAGPSHRQQNHGVTMQASKFAASARKGAQKMKLQKPDEPDFSADGYD